jgi:hypothetical protein
MFLGHPDPLVRDPVLLSSSKNSKKNIDSYCFVTSTTFFILKNDLNIPSKSNKKKKLFC